LKAAIIFESEILGLGFKI